MRSVLILVGLVATAVPGLLACSSAAMTISESSPGAQGSTGRDTADLTGLPAACHAKGALPDPACTPGATDPAVSQANAGSTICVRGYTTRVRPPVSYTDPLKRDMMARYGDTGPAGAYELDHLVPLEVGGNPRSVRNLWPQPRDAHPGSAEKDHLENYLHDQVCAGRMRLADAQRMIATDWLQAWEQAGRP